MLLLLSDIEYYLLNSVKLIFVDTLVKSVRSSSNILTVLFNIVGSVYCLLGLCIAV